ncbi:MAG: hypothetical protein L3J82_04585, partial [Planctomycetes bacterium]|nr:hypothetical protein [Planctomycetota bacterium]
MNDMLNEEFTVTEPALLARFAAGAERRLQEIQTAIESLATGQIDPASLDKVIASSQELKESTLIIGFDRIHALLSDVQLVAEQMAEGKVQPSSPVREALSEAARVLQSLLLAYRDERLKKVPYPRGEVDESDLLSKIEEICDPVPAASMITEKVAKPPEMLQDTIPDESSLAFEEVQEADEYAGTDETEKDSAAGEAGWEDISDSGDLLIDQLLQGIEQNLGTPTISMDEIEGERETVCDVDAPSATEESLDDILNSAPEVQPNLEAPIEDEPEEESLDDILNSAPDVQPNLEAPIEDEPEEESLDDILNSAPEVQPN